LVVFHESWIDNQENKDYINDFLAVTFSGQSGHQSSNARSNHDLAGTFRELDKFARDYLIIFAHVEAENGLWGGLDGGRMIELGKNDLFRQRTAAFQKVRTQDIRTKIKGWLAGWYPSEVEGSDPKSIQEIGRGEETYIKIGASTFEAVQFALKPGTIRLADKAIPNQARSWIRSIRFEGGILNGKQVDFSAEVNCLIGVRGSGKSAVLESLRHALELPMPESEEELDFKYKQDLVRFTLGSGGKVIVEAEDAQGRRYEVRRILGERKDIYYDGELRPGISIPLKNPLFFGQKELVKRGEGSESELVERLLGTKLDAIRRQIAEQRERVLSVLVSLDRLRGIETRDQEFLNRKKDTEFRLKLFQQYGVEQQLRRRIEFDSDVTQVRRIVEVANTFVRSFSTFLQEQETELAGQPRLASKENTTIVDEINKLMDQLRKVPAQAAQSLEEAKKHANKLREKLTELERRRESLKDEFAAIERQLSEQLQQKERVSVRPDDFVKLNAELQNTTLALEELAKSRARRNALRDELLKELKHLNDLWHQEFRQIEAEVKKLNESQSPLRIIPTYKGNRTALLKTLQTHFRGSRLREATLQDALGQCTDFIAMYETIDSICARLAESGETFRRYFDENKASLLTWQTPNLFQIIYHGKELREHSLGQRASALILFILSQRDNDVIIIDQPEDDLDNQTIFEDVIKLIRGLKRNIQFIFATHNANFPVLGDAEQVGACAFADGHADVTVGSIDKPEIQQSIVSIMEGGREAFARRKEIYQLWKQ
jgi:predicted ATPase